MLSLAPDVAWEPARPFWEGTACGELRLPRCDGCGRFQWYPRLLCPQCLGSDFSWPTVDPVGVVYSHTTVHRAFLPGAREVVPFGLVQLQITAAPGVLLVCRGDGVVGQHMRVVFEAGADGVHLPVGVLDPA